jgi:prolyl-tRNA synthetase
MSKEITSREENYAQWYNDLVIKGGLADYSAVKGCMVIKPYGFALWEEMRDELDRMFKETGHENAYFPLFIPKSFLSREAAHVEGFAKECAVVTHYRLKNDPDGGGIIVDPEAKLEEELIVRPTSETIIWNTYKTWIQSYRDLPLLINQWANVVRWELRPRLFLRTAEFLWQEGHTAHETKEEAIEETGKILGIYETFARDFLALPVFTGEKSESERFPGAVQTLCIEAMVQDRKAIQAGTSHFLGQNFSKASGIKFQSREGREEFAWTTSWGVSTRLIGTVVMMHADDDGLILPPRVAPHQVVILPITPKEDTRTAVLEAAEALATRLRERSFHGQPLLVHVDKRDLNGGAKSWDWIKRGCPVRIEIGPRDLASGTVALCRRDHGARAKEFVPADQAVATIPELLQSIQDTLYARALAFREEHTRPIDTKEEFYAFFTAQNADKPEPHGGFALTHWNGSPEVEAKIKDDLKVTIRCIPFGLGEPGVCPFSGQPSARRVVWAKSY